MIDIISNIGNVTKVQIYRENYLVTQLNKFLSAKPTIILYIRVNMMALLSVNFKDMFQKILSSRG
jgi:hypothetical protein